MHTAWRRGVHSAFWAAGLALGLAAEAQDKSSSPSPEPLTLHARVRELASPAKDSSARSFVVKEKELRWNAAQTALIICDMWNQHWCQGATRRVGELAPAMNQAVTAARAKGILIIHAPSSCMDAYKDHRAHDELRLPPRRRISRNTSASGATRFPPKSKESTRSTSPTAVATMAPNARRGRPGSLRLSPSRFAMKTRSAIRGPRSGTCSKAAASPM